MFRSNQSDSKGVESHEVKKELCSDDKQKILAENKKNREISEKLHIVLDIDNTVSTGERAENQEGVNKYLKNFKAYGITQDILQFSIKDHEGVSAIVLQVLHPGAVEYVKWLHHILGARISFFSSGIEERNKPFAKEFLSFALGKDTYERIKDSVSIYSRNDMDSSTRALKDIQYKNFGLTFGNSKKDLKVTLKGHEDLNHTVLVDDDPSYICPGQEKNSLIACGIYSTSCFKLRKSSNVGDLLRLNNIFYITGILKHALEMTRQ